MSQKLTRSSPLLTWCLFIAIGLILAFASGRLSAHFVNDSPSYQNYDFGSLTIIASQTRMPGYAIWLRILTATLGIGSVPAAQVIVHATAVWLLFRELTSWEMQRTMAFIVAASVGVGCTAMDNIHTISSDALAASLGVLSITCTLRWTRLGSSPTNIAITVLATTGAVFVRPAYLFLIPWLFVAGTLLCVMRGPYHQSIGQAIKSALLISVLSALPVLGWMSFRYATVGDVGILPFGHQNLAAILVQLLSDDELRSLGDGSTAGEMGRAIVEIKNRYDKEIGFEAGEPGATMTIDDRWDEMTYFVVVPAAVQVAGEDSVDSHRAIATLNKTIIKRYPLRYANWLVKSARRGAWAIAANIVMHPLFLIAIGVMLLLTLYRSIQGSFGSSILEDSVAIRALTIVTFTYLFCKLGFVILTSPAIGRFSDAAAILVPGWIGVMFLRWWSGRRAEADFERQSESTTTVS